MTEERLKRIENALRFLVKQQFGMAEDIPFEEQQKVIEEATEKVFEGKY